MANWNVYILLLINQESKYFPEWYYTMLNICLIYMEMKIELYSKI